MGLFHIKQSVKSPLLIRFENAVAQYEKTFPEGVDAVTLHINETTVADIERCVKEHKRIEDLWTELKMIKDEDDM